MLEVINYEFYSIPAVNYYIYIIISTYSHPLSIATLLYVLFKGSKQYKLRNVTLFQIQD